MTMTKNNLSRTLVFILLGTTLCEAVRCYEGSQSEKSSQVKQINCTASQCVTATFNYPGLPETFYSFKCGPANCTNIQANCITYVVGSLNLQALNCQVTCCKGELCNYVAPPTTAPATTSHAERLQLRPVKWITCLLTLLRHFLV